eukprot:141770-Alexandrium_andersonii.AAC.1
MVVPAHALGLRTAAPSCPTRLEGSRCVDWALFRFKLLHPASGSAGLRPGEPLDGHLGPLAPGPC